MAFQTKRLLFLLLHIYVGNCAPNPGPVANRGLPTVKNATETEVKQGWTSQPSGRGTFDIIWSCGFTMFLCSWSVLCLNVPEQGDTRFRIFRRKLYVTALAFLGPEFIFQIALGQYISARRSVKDFHASGYSRWTLTHAFYADMGGFILQTRGWTPFPIDAKQLHYLVTEHYVEFPKLEKKGIADKNKVDGLLRIITLFQILWFVINMAGRAAQHLEITAGELTTAAFIVCSIGTTVVWLQKPADVSMPEIIECSSSMAEILVKAGESASQPYSRTPLDFVSRKEWPWSLYWSNWINIIRHMGIVFGPPTRPVNRFENTISLEVEGPMKWVMFAMAAAYTGTFVCGWNYNFPTRTELMLWRAASGTMCATLVVYLAITEVAFNLYPRIRKHLTASRNNAHEVECIRTTEAAHKCGYLVSKAKAIAARIRNNSVSKDPQLTVPLRAILPIYIVGVFYCHARTYVFVGDIIQLRSLPASAYISVDWIGFIPHF
jgi:hypothetical protein